MAPYSFPLMRLSIYKVRKLPLPERLGLIEAGWTLTDHMLPDPQSFHTYLTKHKINTLIKMSSTVPVALMLFRRNPK
jgi:hypothetical protein